MPRGSAPRPRWARWSSAGQSRSDPTLVPGQLTVADAAAGRSTLTALLVGVGIGALVLIPSLVWLFRLTLGGASRRTAHHQTPGRAGEPSKPLPQGVKRTDGAAWAR